MTVGVRPSSWLSSRWPFLSLFSVSVMWIGSRIVRLFSAIARVIPCRIHQYAYVLNL